MENPPAIETGQPEPSAKPRHRPKGPGLAKAAFAQEMDLSLKDVDRMIADGKVRVVRLGRLERIPRTEPQRILAEMGEAAE